MQEAIVCVLQHFTAPFIGCCCPDVPPFLHQGLNHLHTQCHLWCCVAEFDHLHSRMLSCNAVFTGFGQLHPRSQGIATLGTIYSSHASCQLSGCFALHSEFYQLWWSVPGFGQLHPRSQGITTLGTIYSSSVFEGRAPQGQHLVLNFIGGATNRGIIDQSSAELVSQVAALHCNALHYLGCLLWCLHSLTLMNNVYRQRRWSLYRCVWLLDLCRCCLLPQLKGGACRMVKGYRICGNVPAMWKPLLPDMGLCPKTWTTVMDNIPTFSNNFHVCKVYMQAHAAQFIAQTLDKTLFGCVFWS